MDKDQFSSEFLSGLGSRIKRRRKELNLTQEELAKRLGYEHKTSISKLEKGINDVPSAQLLAIASALETSIPYLMGWIDNTDQDAEDEIRIFDHTSIPDDLVILQNNWQKITSEDKAIIKIIAAKYT